MLTQRWKNTLTKLLSATQARVTWSLRYRIEWGPSGQHGIQCNFVTREIKCEQLDPDNHAQGEIQRQGAKMRSRRHTKKVDHERLQTSQKTACSSGNIPLQPTVRVGWPDTGGPAQASRNHHPRSIKLVKQRTNLSVAMGSP